MCVRDTADNVADNLHSYPSGGEGLLHVHGRGVLVACGLLRNATVTVSFRECAIVIVSAKFAQMRANVRCGMGRCSVNSVHMMECIVNFVW